MRVPKLWLLATLAIAASFVSSDAFAEADGPDYYAVRGVAADDVLNMRAEPAASSAKIGDIPHDGRGLQNLGCQGGPSFAQWQAMSEAKRGKAGKERWCKVRYKGLEGWVASRFLSEDSNP